MKLITEIGQEEKQTLNVTLETNEILKLSLEYNPQYSRWYINLDYNNRSINGIRLCTHSNLLYQWKNLLPFGIMVLTKDMSEPFLIDDFTSGRAEFYILNANDVLTINDTIHSLL